MLAPLIQLRPLHAKIQTTLVLEQDATYHVSGKNMMPHPMSRCAATNHKPMTYIICNQMVRDTRHHTWFLAGSTAGAQLHACTGIPDTQIIHRACGP